MNSFPYQVGYECPAPFDCFFGEFYMIENIFCRVDPVTFKGIEDIKCCMLFGDIDPPQIVATIGKKFCFAMDSYKLLGRLDKTLKNFAENIPEALEQVKLISEGLSDNSNPILVVFAVQVK